LIIRAELPAHATNQNNNLDINTLLKVEKLLIHLEGKGKSENTRIATEKNLKLISQRANLDNPEEVELAIARYKCVNDKSASNAYKAKLCDAYQHYCKFSKIIWEKPIYRPDEKGIQPPTDEQCKILIGGIKGELSIKVQLSAETGLRPCEIMGKKGLKVRDIHTDQHTVTATSAKGCNARPALKISEELIARIKTLMSERNLKTEDSVFTGHERRYGEHFRRARNNLSNKLQMPELRNIRLYDLRHYYVTKQLRKIQNAEFVRQIVGHKRLNTTQRYMHLLANTNGEWIVEGTTDKERAKQLLTADFTYQLTTPDGTMLFKKPK
jgi:integrase